MWSTLFLLLIASCAHAQRFLSVQNDEFRLNDEKVFLSGMNIAWHEFGYDFGNDRYECCTGPQLEQYLRDIAAAGGNSVRIWLHCDARFTPEFDNNGFVTGADETGSFINDLARYLDVAEEVNILVTLVLWNGAISFTPDMRGLIFEDDKLQSYIDNALTPMAEQLADKVALGSWEVMNEPEGSLAIAYDDNPCFDTTPLEGSGAGWVGENVPMYNFLRFINLQNGAIKRADPKALTTLGSWTERPQTDNFNYFNYYKDECLIAAGGDEEGTLDFYQMHSYEWEGSYSDTSPFILSADAYDLDKPNVIGEFSQDGSDGRDITELFEWGYTQGYGGVWSWQANGGGHHSDDFDTQARGCEQLRGRNEDGGRVDIDLQ